jgi:hypothetical protein
MPRDFRFWPGGASEFRYNLDVGCHPTDALGSVAASYNETANSQP